MEVLQKAGSAILLLVGALYPLAAIFMMMKFLARADAPRPSFAFLLINFVLIATVPLAGILGGFAGFAPVLWESQVIRVIVYGAGLLSLVALAALFISMRGRQPDGGG